MTNKKTIPCRTKSWSLLSNKTLFLNDTERRQLIEFGQRGIGALDSMSISERNKEKCHLIGKFGKKRERES